MDGRELEIRIRATAQGVADTFRDVGNAVSDLSDRVTNAAAKVGVFAGGIGALGVAMQALPGPAWVAPFILLAAVLAPLVVPLIALATLFTVATGGIVGAGAAIFLLGKHTDAGTQAWKNFTAQFDAMLIRLGNASQREFLYMLQFLRGWIPLIEQTGMALVAWFEKRAPAIFSFLTEIVKITSGALLALGKTISTVVDYVLANHARFENFWKMVMVVAVGAIQLLLQFCMNLANWFFANWPKLQDTVKRFVDEFTSGFSKATVGGFTLWAALQIGIGIVGKIVQQIKNLGITAQGAGFIVGLMANGVSMAVVVFLAWTDATLRLINFLKTLIGISVGAWAQDIRNIVGGLIGMFQGLLNIIGAVGKALGGATSPTVGAGHPTGNKHSGGAITSTGLHMLQAGEYVSPPGGGGGGGAGGTAVFHLHMEGSTFLDDAGFDRFYNKLSRKIASEISMHSAFRR